MTIYILAEGASELAFFQAWTTKLRVNQGIVVHPHRGKGALPADPGEKVSRKRQGLLDVLPTKLKGFEECLNPQTDSVIVLVDADDDDVTQLHASIEGVATAYCPSLNVGVCIASEEMEAFYLSDLSAVSHAYPHYNKALAATYVPDSVCGTWELFRDVIGDLGHDKVGWAKAMGKYCTTSTAKTMSPSYRHLLRTIATFANVPPVVPTVKKKAYHRAKPKP